MKIFYVLFLFAISTSAICPQWTNLNPVPDGTNLHSVYFIDDNTGWIAGEDGFITKTINAGVDWVQQNSGTAVTLHSVQFITLYTGYIIGDAGTVLKTTDGGLNWTPQTSGTTQNLYDLSFYDLNIGCAVGNSGTILRTTNGGANWTITTISDITKFVSVDFVNALVGWVVGSGTIQPYEKIFKTTDGGINWVDFSSYLTEIWDSPSCVEFVNENVGFIGTEYYRDLYKTTDGGFSWSDVTYKASNGPTFQEGVHDIYFKNENLGYYIVCGVGDIWSYIYKTTNGGETWLQFYGDYPIAHTITLTSLSVTNNGRLWVVGSEGKIIFSDDDGQTRNEPLDLNSSEHIIYSVFFIDENIGWAGGQVFSYEEPTPWEIIFKTTDGGKYWRVQYNMGSAEQPCAKELFFIHQNIGWALLTYSSYSGDTYKLLKTSDGGQNWYDTYANFNSGDDFGSLYFISQNTGWAVNKANNIGVYKTNDGGRSWVLKNDQPSLSVYFADANNGWAVGLSGLILKSTDGGENWVAKTSGTAEDLNKVVFHNTSLGMCVGNSGVVLLTTDGGENWSPKSSGTAEDLSSVCITSPTSAWVAGTNGKILSTIDLGDDWTSYDGLTTSSIIDLGFFNEYTGWAAGESILKYSTESTGSCDPGWIAETNQQYNISVIAVLKFDDVVSLNEEDVIGAFVGSECRGIASPIAVLGGKIFLTISSSQLSGETVTFKAWKSSTCEQLPVLETMDFVNQGEVGTLDNPFVFNGGMIEHVYDFGSGYSWISVNINPGDMGVNTVFDSLQASANDRIIGQTSFAVYDAGSSQWVGSLLNIDYTQMYIMKLAIADEFPIQGLPVNPSANPISLNPGYTWINYLPQTSMPINTALAHMTVNPTSNDRFIGQTQFAVYDDSSGQWVGSLHNLDPGVGYKIKLTNATVLTYPPNSFAPINSIEPLAKIEAVPDWTPIPNQQFNMQIIGEIEWDGLVSTNSNDIIGAFVGNECRGVANPNSSLGVYFLTVGSNQQTGEDITFKVYHSDLDKIDDNLNYPTVTFVNQGEVGTLGNPFTIESPLLVELTSFTADINNNKITLNWITKTEVNNYGFDVEKKTTGNWEKIGFVQGTGSSISSNQYSFTDSKLIGSGIFKYRLKQIDYNGQFEYSDEIEAELVPTEYALYQNYPNPFNPVTTIRYQLPKESKVVIKIYDMLGSEVMEILNDRKETGIYQVEFNAETLSSGTYIYRIIAESFMETKKMILLK